MVLKSNSANGSDPEVLPREIECLEPIKAPGCPSHTQAREMRRHAQDSIWNVLHLGALVDPES
jgi:hypothetical protein